MPLLQSPKEDLNTINKFTSFIHNCLSRLIRIGKKEIDETIQYCISVLTRKTRNHPPYLINPEAAVIVTAGTNKIQRSYEGQRFQRRVDNSDHAVSFLNRKFYPTAPTHLSLHEEFIITAHIHARNYACVSDCICHVERIQVLEARRLFEVMFSIKIRLV